MSGIFFPEYTKNLPDAARPEPGTRYDAPDSAHGREAASAFAVGCADDALHFPPPAAEEKGFVPGSLSVWGDFAWSMECRSGDGCFSLPGLPDADASGANPHGTDPVFAVSRLEDLVSGDSLDVETLAGLLGEDSLDTGCGTAFVSRGMSGGVDANAVIDAGAEATSTGPDDAALLAHLFGM